MGVHQLDHLSYAQLISLASFNGQGVLNKNPTVLLDERPPPISIIMISTQSLQFFNQFSHTFQVRTKQLYAKHPTFAPYLAFCVFKDLFPRLTFTTKRRKRRRSRLRNGNEAGNRNRSRRLNSPKKSKTKSKRKSKIKSYTLR